MINTIGVLARIEKENVADNVIDLADYLTHKNKIIKNVA